MKCQYCGNEIPMGANNCGYCGSPVMNDSQSVNLNKPTAGPSFYPDYDQGGNVMPGITSIASKKELIKIPQCAELKKNLNVSAIIGYICVALTLVLNVIVLGYIYGLLDVAIVLGCTLGFHLAYSKGAAIGLLVYSIFNFCYMIVETGKPGGWMIVFVAVYALLITVKLDKVWKEYQRSGILPNEVVKIK